MSTDRFRRSRSTEKAGSPPINAAGITFVASGTLFFGAGVLVIWADPPPSDAPVLGMIGRIQQNSMVGSGRLTLNRLLNIARPETSMTHLSDKSRRDVLRTVVLAGGISALAGCTTPESGEENDEAAPGPEEEDDPETAPDDEEDEDTAEDPDDETEDEETETPEDEPEEEDDPDDEEVEEDDEDGEEDEEPEEEDEDETDNEEADIDDEWADVDEIVLDGITAGWEGVEPAPIEGEENPTLVLTEGEEYDIVWENIDGQPHNIEIWDDEEEVVDDYETEIIEEEGETQTLTVEATSDMTDYVCVVHIGTMRGDIEVQPANTE